MSFVVIGLTLVGLSTLSTSKNNIDENTNNAVDEGNRYTSLQTLGNFLVISAQVLHAYQGVCQERLVRLYRVPPLQMIGIEGVYGIALTLCLLAFLQLVPNTV
uniref:Transmembrane protein C2orf18 n=1 Tax=Lygus hesperus TaxID=30085 RepID=A0A0A9Y1F3_LYGHE